MWTQFAEDPAIAYTWAGGAAKENPTTAMPVMELRPH